MRHFVPVAPEQASLRRYGPPSELKRAASMHAESRLTIRSISDKIGRGRLPVKSLVPEVFDLPFSEGADLKKKGSVARGKGPITGRAGHVGCLFAPPSLG
ncbi:hypothetical protein BaRGS_00002909 [Batillaria attramentaria]|uniref:Uncharacterized protein n=1 Tax=Batillaria attramentaria TaxID=370345 RepID=A0ABD0M2Z7_9CAEN